VSAEESAQGGQQAGGRGAVVVTGASSGIGRACALHLDSLGFRVFAGVRKEADAEGLRAEGSERLEPLSVDVADQGSIDAAAERVSGEVGESGLAGLVNNAGISVVGPMEFLPIDELRRQLEVNLIGQVAVTQSLMPELRRAAGRIVFISSIGGRLASPFMTPYHASKWAIEATADALRLELRPWDIEVVLVEPGSIDTRIWEKGQAQADEIESGMGERGRELYGRQIAAAREAARRTAADGIPPERVAEVVGRALTADRPRTRYLVGTDAKIAARLRKLLPDRVFDRLLARQLGL
jgi:NAD(P)-dependent dehydrogenase (short-subunit alcohol dehydrogenase family)